MVIGKQSKEWRLREKNYEIASWESYKNQSLPQPCSEALVSSHQYAKALFPFQGLCSRDLFIYFPSKPIISPIMAQKRWQQFPLSLNLCLHNYSDLCGDTVLKFKFRISRKTAVFHLQPATMSDWNRYKNHFLLYDVWINESIKPF